MQPRHTPVSSPTAPSSTPPPPVPRLPAPWVGEAVVRFVRETLGCGCPDEVFQRIEVVDMEVAGVALTRLVVGKTLLIYLPPIDAWRRVESELEALVRAGRWDRDRHDYNRFRLVTVGGAGGEGGEGAENALRDRFLREAGEDAKLHFHIVKPAQVQALRAPSA